MALAQACAQGRPADGLAALTSELKRILAHTWPEADPAHVLTRTGWHRLGGVVDGSYQRVADNISHWADAHSGGDVDELMDKYLESGYFATRWQGQTHFISVPFGEEPEAYLQVEVEELQEVIDRILMDRDWFPESIEEFLEPLDVPRLEPEPVGDARYVFRRATAIPDLLSGLDPARSASVKLKRFFSEWQESSASRREGPFCRHWVLALQETQDADGSCRFNAKPAATNVLKPGDCGDPRGLKGAMLANWLLRVDRAAGYPFAWYFQMVATRIVPVSVGARVKQDLDEGFDYLPERDAKILRDWVADPYHF